MALSVESSQAAQEKIGPSHWLERQREEPGKDTVDKVYNWFAAMVEGFLNIIIINLRYSTQKYFVEF